jgi:hypothetical protein
LKRLLLTITLFGIFSIQSFSWLYPEHRDITFRAIKNLDAHHRKMLDDLWSLARAGNETRLSYMIIDTAQGISPDHLDYAAWPAISGDHSCSPEHLVDIILNSDWIMRVADITARLKVGFANSRNGSEKENYMRDAE